MLYLNFFYRVAAGVAGAQSKGIELLFMRCQCNTSAHGEVWWAWLYLSRYQFSVVGVMNTPRLLIRRRVQSPETNAQALVPSEPANMPAESRTRVNVRDQFIYTLSASKEWMVCGVGSTSPVTAWYHLLCHHSCDDFCQSFNDMVISLWYHQSHGARASIEGGFFESKKATW